MTVTFGTVGTVSGAVTDGKDAALADVHLIMQSTFPARRAPLDRMISMSVMITHTSHITYRLPLVT